MPEYITKNAAINAVENAPIELFQSEWEEIEEAINTAPAADVIPRPHWIPADEELPPNGQEVLCWYEYFRYGLYNRMYQAFGIGYQFNGNWGGEVARGRDAKVLAWMPLPKPPEMDGGADNG